MNSRVRETKTGEGIPLIFEEAIRKAGWKTDYVFRDMCGHGGVLETFDDVNRGDKNGINFRTLATMCVELPTGESVIACYCENPGGHGTIDYAVCTRKKAEQCMRVMTPGIQSSPQSIRDYIVAADIEMAPPIVVGEIRRERKPGKLCGGEENE